MDIVSQLRCRNWIVLYIIDISIHGVMNKMNCDDDDGEVVIYNNILIKLH